MADDGPVSAKTIYVSGIPVHVYGLSALEWPGEPASAPAHARPLPVDCLWLLHRRKGDHTQMLPFATRMLRAWNDNPLSRDRGLIVVAFDHRNHGARLVDPTANLGWKQNAMHAVDLYTILYGTAADVSLLIDCLEPYLFPGRSAALKLDTHMLLGASLGGHSAWHCALGDDRIRNVVSVIGCPDYIELMSGRARDADRIRPGQDLIGTPDFPDSLARTVRRTDPMCRLRADQHSSADPAVVSALDGKRILCLSGGRDALVPHARSRPFTVQLRPGGLLHRVRAQVRDVIDDEAGHEFTGKMEACARDFLVDCLERRAKGCHQLRDDTIGFSTLHI